MKEIHKFKDGDEFKIRTDIKYDIYYQNNGYYICYPRKENDLNGYKDDYFIRSKDDVLYPIKMISEVNGKKVKFIDEVKYIIIEEEMIDPKSLVKSGDFVVYERNGKEYSSVAIQRGDYIGLAIYPTGWCYLSDSKIIIKKIFRYMVGSYSICDVTKGTFFESCGKFVYDSEKETKEMTMEEVNKALGYKVKIVEGK